MDVSLRSLFLVLLLVEASKSICPENCKCRYFGMRNLTTVKCRGIGQVPCDKIPSTTVQLWVLHHTTGTWARQNSLHSFYRNRTANENSKIFDTKPSLIHQWRSVGFLGNISVRILTGYWFHITMGISSKIGHTFVRRVTLQPQATTTAAPTKTSSNKFTLF